MPKNIGKGSGGAGGAGTKPPESAAIAGSGAITPGNPAPPTPAGVTQAFEASPGFRDNTVNMVELRERLGGTRAEQDAAIKAAWHSGKISLETYENHALPAGHPRFQAVAQNALYVSPRPEGHPLARFRSPDGRWYQEVFSLVSKGQNW